MMARFQFEQPPHDSEIIKRTDLLKLTLFREENGDLSGSFEIEGSFGNFSEDGNQEGVTDGLRFVHELMREFTRRSEG